MKKIKVLNKEWMPFGMLVKYADECFELFTDPYGGSCFIFKRKVVCFTKLQCEMFSSPMRTVFLLKGDIDLDISNNKIRFNTITSFELLNKFKLFELVCDLYDYTGINFMSS